MMSEKWRRHWSHDVRATTDNDCDLSSEQWWRWHFVELQRLAGGVGCSLPVESGKLVGGVAAASRQRWLAASGNIKAVERTGKHGTPRAQYLQELVTQFQTATNEESKEKIAAHLANFAYDPYNYTFLRQLNVLELFLDCITEENEKLIEFGVGGICNSCIDPANAAIIIQCGGIPLVIQCLSSPVTNTVNYALGALYYLCNSQTKEEILKPEVVEVIKKYATAEINVSFINLAKAFLIKHVNL